MPLRLPHLAQLPYRLHTPWREHWLFAARLAVFPFVWASLVLPPVNMAPTPVDWAASFAAATVSVAATRWPLAALLAQSALLAALWFLPGPIAAGTVQLFVALAVAEVIVRRRGAVLVTSVAVAELVTMLNVARGTGFAPLPLITRMLLIVGGTVVVGALVRAVRATIHEAEERAREVERRRESDTRAARAEERTAIARELHDLVAHHLSSIVLRTGVARHVVPDPGDARIGEVLDEVHGDASAALSDLRQLVSVLRDPDRVDEGPGVPLVDADLPAALEVIVERVRQAGLEVSARIDPRITELDTMRRLAVLRLAQEGLTNALRHAAGATRAVLTIERRPGEVRVEVTDDGAGHPARPAGPAHGPYAGPPAGVYAGPYARADADGYGDAGHGLAGMRERVDLVGGRFFAGPIAGPPAGDPGRGGGTREPVRDVRGWHVVAELPTGDPVAAP